MERRRDAGTQTGGVQLRWSIWGDLERFILSKKTSTALTVFTYCMHQWAVYNHQLELGVFLYVISMTFPSILSGCQRLMDIRDTYHRYWREEFQFSVIWIQYALELLQAGVGLCVELTFSCLLPITNAGFFCPIDLTKNWVPDSQNNGNNTLESTLIAAFDQAFEKAIFIGSVFKFIALIVTFWHIVYNRYPYIRIAVSVMLTACTAVGQEIATLDRPLWDIPEVRRILLMNLIILLYLTTCSIRREWPAIEVHVTTWITCISMFVVAMYSHFIFCVVYDPGCRPWNTNMRCIDCTTSLVPNRRFINWDWIDTLGMYVAWFACLLLFSVITWSL